MTPKRNFWAIFGYFFLVFGYFFPISWGRPKPIFFLVFFVLFLARGPKMLAGRQGRNSWKVLSLETVVDREGSKKGAEKVLCNRFWWGKGNTPWQHDPLGDGVLSFREGTFRFLEAETRLVGEYEPLGVRPRNTGEHQKGGAKLHAIMGDTLRAGQKLHFRWTPLLAISSGFGPVNQKNLQYVLHPLWGKSTCCPPPRRPPPRCSVKFYTASKTSDSRWSTNSDQ